MKEPDYSALPTHIQTGMRNWIDRGIKPGGFLRACLSNDFLEACTRADTLLKTELPAIARWMIHNLPEGSFGKPEVLQNWPLFVAARMRQEADQLTREANDAS